MNNAVSGKTMKNLRKHRDIKLFTTEKRRNYLVPQPNYHTTTFFTEKVLAIEVKENKILMNKSVYLGLPILDLLILYLSKTLMYEFWSDYLKPKYGENVKLWCMNTDRLFKHVKTDDIYKDIAEDFETRFCTSNSEIGTPLPKEKNEKVIRLKQDELGGQIMKEFTGL